MYTVLLIVVILVAVLLTLIVLIQNPKGGGLSGEFGGAGTSQMFGVQRTGDLLEQLTWGFAIFIMVAALGSHFLVDKTAAGEGVVNSVNIDKAQTKSTPTPAGTLNTTPAKDSAK